MLAVGAALLGSPAVLGLDLDPDALEVALSNAGQFDAPLPLDFARADVAALAAGEPGWARLRADTVVMNPPFGARRKGADVEFLYAAAALLRRGGGGAAYSLHKSSTRAHLQKVATRCGLGPGCGAGGSGEAGERPGVYPAWERAAGRFARCRARWRRTARRVRPATGARPRHLARRELGCSEAEVLCELRYDLPATYKFHKCGGRGGRQARRRGGIVVARNAGAGPARLEALWGQPACGARGLWQVDGAALR